MRQSAKSFDENIIEVSFSQWTVSKQYFSIGVRGKHGIRND